MLPRLDSSPVSSGLGVYEIFDGLYSEEMKDVANKLFPRRQYNIGIHDTMDRGKNHFHAGVVSLFGELLFVDDNLKRKIAATAEYSWTAIVVLDDLGDGELIRRESKALWLEKSALYASQAAWAASADVLHVLQQLSLNGHLPPSAIADYISTLRRIAKGQILREQLDFTSSIEAFWKSILAISCHLPWAVGLVLHHSNSGFAWHVGRALRDLQFAASLKNDLEDYFPPSSRYKQGGTDILRGQITYPLKMLHSNLDAVRQQQLEEYLLSKEKDEETIRAVIDLLKSNNDVVDCLFEELHSLVFSALAKFDKGCRYLSAEVQASTHVELLREWILSYKHLGNPNIQA